MLHKRGLTWLAVAAVVTTPARAQISHDMWGQGGIRIGDSTTTCDASAEGAVRYNDTTNVHQFCNGTVWADLGGGSLWTDHTTYISRAGIVAITGTHGAGDTLALSGSGTRAFFYPRKSAFRAGGAGATEWDDANIGEFSAAFGNESKATGQYAVAFGYRGDAAQPAAIAGGDQASAWATGAIALGRQIQLEGDRSVGLGNRARTGADADYSMAIGLGDPGGTPPTVTQPHSLGIFLGDQSGVTLATANVMAVMGGKLGIGTTSPASPLTVSSSAATDVFINPASTSGVASLSFQNGGGAFGTNSNAWQINNNGAFRFVSGNNGVAPLVLNASTTYSNENATVTGSLGIGANSSPINLKIYTHASGGTGTIAFTKYGGANSGLITYYNEDNTNPANDYLAFSVAATERMRVTGTGNVGVGTTTPAAKFVVAPPTTETIAAGATLTADACGTLKRIEATANRTTSTTNTFTAPTASHAGCCMDVVNVDPTDTVTLDANASFKTNGGADQALGPDDTVRVCSDGIVWYQVSAVSANQ